MRILYHDDFDGMASAALLSAWLDEPCDYVAVDHGQDLGWDLERPKAAPVGEEFTVVDFLYHPAAAYWFDHHQEPFRYPGYAESYANRAATLGELVVHQIYPSCAGLIADILMLDKPYAELVTAATMIDTADYPSPKAWFEAKHPAMALSQAHHLLTAAKKSQVIETLIHYSLHDARDLCSTEVQEVLTRNFATLDQMTDIMHLHGNTVIVDLVRQDTPFVRYAPYYFYPDIEYALTLFRANDLIRVSLGKNPWRDTPHHNLSAFAKQIPGGGGHPYAAGCHFAPKDYVDHYSAAWRFCAVTAERLNQPMGDD